MRRLLVVSDGRRGIENQALGLAEALVRQTDQACEIATHILTPSPAFAALPPSLQLMGRRDFGLPDADLVIGCGRQAIAPLLALRRSGHPAYRIYVQDPRMDPSRFDLVVAPHHDGLEGPFVEAMIGSPNRVTRERIVAGTLAEADALKRLPGPRAMIAIGGPSRTHSLGPDEIGAHLDAARSLHGQGYSLLITASRRTPDRVQADWEAFARNQDSVWLHTPDSEGNNPYFAFLGGADILLVTEDSTNMLTEACATGKPVFRLPMAGAPGKFQHLYDALEKRCRVRRWDEDVPVESYDALRETDRVARQIWTRLEN